MELEGRTPPWREGIPFPERSLSSPHAEPVKVVQPFPTLIDRPDETIVPPREWGTLVTTPEPQRLAA